MEKKIVNSTTVAVDDLVQLALAGDSRFWVDYDKEADVLYVNFGHPQKADDSVLQEGIIQRKKKGKIIGLTILNASHFGGKG